MAYTEWFVYLWPAVLRAHKFLFILGSHGHAHEPSDCYGVVALRARQAERGRERSMRVRTLPVATFALQLSAA